MEFAARFVSEKNIWNAHIVERGGGTIVGLVRTDNNDERTRRYSHGAQVGHDGTISSLHFHHAR